MSENLKNSMKRSFDTFDSDNEDTNYLNEAFSNTPPRKYIKLDETESNTPSFLHVPNYNKCKFNFYSNLESCVYFSKER